MRDTYEVCVLPKILCIYSAVFSVIFPKYPRKRTSANIVLAKIFVFSIVLHIELHMLSPKLQMKPRYCLLIFRKQFSIGCPSYVVFGFLVSWMVVALMFHR